MSNDERYKGRIPIPRPGGPMKDKRKSARKDGQRGQAIRRQRKYDES